MTTTHGFLLPSSSKWPTSQQQEFSSSTKLWQSIEPAGAEMLFVKFYEWCRNIGSRKPRNTDSGEFWEWRSGLSTSTNASTEKESQPSILPEPTMVPLRLPVWASNDADERQRLAKMKTLLQPEFERLQHHTVKVTTAMKNGLSATSKQSPIQAFPDVYSDIRLLRFLQKDQPQNPRTAAARYHNFLKWREKYNVDEIRSVIEERSHSNTKDGSQKTTARTQNLFDPVSGAPFEILEDYLPTSFSSDPATSDGGVVPVLFRLGTWDTQGVTKLISNGILSIDEFLTFWIYKFEALQYHLYKESVRGQRMVYIDEQLDMSGISLSQLSPTFVSRLLRPWVKMTQSNYPETVHSIICLEPPKIVTWIWTIIVSPLLSAGTVAKVRLSPDFDGTADDYMETYQERSPS